MLDQRKCPTCTRPHPSGQWRCTWCEHCSLVRRMLAIEDGMTEWEVDFAEDLSRKVIDGGRTLTEREMAKVEQVLEDREP